MGKKEMKARCFSYALKNGILVGIGTFFLSIIFNLGSQSLLEFFRSAWFKFVLLGLIILVGVLFDIIGVSAAVANESPFHAQAATRKYGARQAVKVVRNADRVASFCNDVVGDISGILSGAIGASILFELIKQTDGWEELVFGTLLTAFIAALTVGGKAAGKSLAIEHANEVVLRVGMLIAFIEDSIGIPLLGNGPKKGRKK